jgi:hypothetical protein
VDAEGESPLWTVVAVVLWGGVFIAWLRNPGNHWLQALVAFVAAGLAVSFFTSGDTRARLNLALTAILFLVTFIYIAVQGIWWATVIYAVLLLPLIAFRVAAIIVSFTHPELAEDD